MLAGRSRPLEAPVIDHSVSLAHPEHRTVRVELTCELADGVTAQDVAFPVWTPGSYLVREHARHVHDFEALADGRPAEAVKVSKDVYRIRTDGARRLTVRYEAYAHELTVRTCHVDASHAFLNPVALLAYLPGREHESQRLTVRDRPAGWGVACALEQDATSALLARDYDELADSPLECGPHAAESARRRFDVRGVPHEIVHWGRSNLDLERFTADCAKIAEAQASLFGGLPYPRYLFIVHASDTGRGGLEHRSSAALLYSRAALAKPKGMDDFLGLASHELFHAWNVKRIKPAAFTPYDLSRECQTRLLWAFEGLTSYYEDIFLVRAGLLTKARFLEILGERLTQLERTPGRLRHSLEEASWDAWIRYYRQDENSENSSVSYYLKGSLAGALLDLELRRRTGGERSLDDVMRRLWSEFGRVGRGVPEDGIERAFEAVSGESAKALFDVVVRGRSDLPLDEALAAHGLELVRRASTGLEDRGGLTGSGPPLACDIGVSLRNEGDRVRIGTVRRGSPAESAGLAPGDELIAIDGLRADAGSSFQRLHDRAPGSTARLQVFRREELLAFDVVAGAPRLDIVSVQETADSTPAARALLERWLGPA